MLQTNKIHLLSLEVDPKQKYYLFLPAGKSKGLAVNVHGLSINADSHISMLAPLAEKFGFALLAPVFPPEDSPQYNLLGPGTSGRRSDLVFNDILEDVSRRTGIYTSRIFLNGYSAGGQFAHRYALAYPERIQALSVSSPGFYTMPDDSVLYPYGLKGMDHTLGKSIDFQRFLHIPLLVNVGDEDTVRGGRFLITAELDKTQGMTRVERAKTWFSSIKAEAVKRGIQGFYRFELLHGVGHSFEASMEKTCMGDLIFQFFDAVRCAE